MEVSAIKVAVTFLLVFFASLFSGMSGGGGALITIPFFIALGLSPQQAIATNKFVGFGIGLGSTAAFKKKALEKPRLLTFLLVMAVIISLFVPTIFKSIGSDTFQIIIAVIMLCSVPMLLANKNEGLKPMQTSIAKKVVGSVLIAIVFLFQGVFSGGIGALNNILLITFFGLTTIEANAVKRIATLALNTFILLALITTTSYIIYPLAIAGLVASLIGGYIGSRMVLKEGERFAKYALVAFILVSAIVLLITGVNSK